MKKYFLLLAVFAAMTFAMSSCEPPGTNGGDDGGGTPTTNKWKADSAVYYGEKLAAKFGLYSVYFSKTSTDGKDVQKFKLDFISSVATDLTKIKPVGGDYKFGTKEDLQKLTYIVAANESDETGSIYTDNGTPVLVTGGVVKITVAAGAIGYKLNLKSGDKPIEFSADGATKFIDRSVAAPRTAIVADRAAVGYRGEFGGSAADLGVISLQLWQSSIPNTVLELAITVPLPKDVYEAEKVKIPTGTFNVVSSVSNAGELAPGTISGGLPINSWESRIVRTPEGSFFNGGVSIQGGTVTITETGTGQYTITTKLNGKSFNSGGEPLNDITGVDYSITDVKLGEYMFDYTYPLSSLKEDLKLTNLTKIYLDPTIWGNQADATTLWRLMLTEETLGFALNPDTSKLSDFYVKGEGDCISIQVITKASETFVTGNFTMPATNASANSAQSVVSADVLPSNVFGPGAGTAYCYIGEDENGQLTNLKYGGSIMGPDKGYVNMTTVGAKVKIDVLLYDKYNHKIETSVEAEMTTMVTSTRAMSNYYIPASSFISLFNGTEQLILQ